MDVHVLNDPVHGVMKFDNKEKELIKSIIDTPIFQRLRNIKQLGMASYVFPGAVHTRFNHSLGAAYLAKTVCEQLGPDIDEKTKLNGIATALLHDIGHGPFSHAFEDIFKRYLGFEINHEDWTPYILDKLSANSKIDKKILAHVSGVITKKDKKSISTQLVSSQLDVDRLDYLLRDSHFSGVSYGKFDVLWLIRCLVLDKKRILVSYKGIGAVEQFLAARRLMTQNLYYNGKIKAAEDYMVRFLEVLLDEIEKGTKLGNSCSETLSLFLFKIVEFKKKKLNESKKDILLKNCVSDYVRLTEDDFFYSISQLANTKKKFLNKDLSKMAKNILERRFPIVFELMPDLSNEVSSQLKTFLEKNKKYKNYQIKLIEKPFRTYKADEEKILVRTKSRVELKLDDASELIGRLSDVKEPRRFLAVDQDAANHTVIIKFISNLKAGTIT